MTMTVCELIDELQRLIHDKYEVADYPVSVAFRWKGDTVCSDIKSFCLNGRNIQLNEEDFDRICGKNWIIRREGE